MLQNVSKWRQSVQIHRPSKNFLACGEHQFFCIGLSRGYTIFTRYAHRERCSVHAEGAYRRSRYAPQARTGLYRRSRYAPQARTGSEVRAARRVPARTGGAGTRRRRVPYHRYAPPGAYRGTGTRTECTLGHLMVRVSLGWRGRELGSHPSPYDIILGLGVGHLRVVRGLQRARVTPFTLWLAFI